MAAERKRSRRRSRSAAFAEDYIDRLCGVLRRLDTDAIGEVADALQRARRAGRRVFILGNGGSAATAMHMVNDMRLGCAKRGGRGFRAVSLTDNISVLTALANDVSYEDVFVKQLEPALHRGDVVILISASGNSPNIIRAARFARRRRAVTIGFVGFDGGKLLRLCDHAVWAETAKGDYGPVEDIHMVLDHLLTGYFQSVK